MTSQLIECTCEFCRTTLAGSTTELKNDIVAVAKTINNSKDYGSMIGIPGYTYKDDPSHREVMTAICHLRLKHFRICKVQFNEEVEIALKSKFVSASQVAIFKEM